MSKSLPLTKEFLSEINGCKCGGLATLGSNRNGWVVECFGCGKRGVRKQTPEGAVKDWNDFRPCMTFNHRPYIEATSLLPTLASRLRV